MSKTFRPFDPEQMFLMPASMRDWLPANHLAYFISDVVEQLDLSAIMQRYTYEERGYPPYHPEMMVKVLLYPHAAVFLVPAVVGLFGDPQLLTDLAYSSRLAEQNFGCT